MDDVADIVRLSRQIAEANLLLQHVRRLAVEADSEFSAIAHGRPPSDKETLLRLSQSFRDLYEKRIPTARPQHDWCANPACPTCTARLAAEKASQC